MILIDGYNLLYTACSAGPPGDKEMEELLESLRKYKKAKGHTITVVLDGYAGGMPMERSQRAKGIGLVYSKLGEKADQTIERLVEKQGGSCVVVTSDREVIASVEKSGAVTLGSDAFLERLRMAEYLEREEDFEPDAPGKTSLDTRKKGNPRRRPKKERARHRRLKKL